MLLTKSHFADSLHAADNRINAIGMHVLSESIKKLPLKELDLGGMIAIQIRIRTKLNEETLLGPLVQLGLLKCFTFCHSLLISALLVMISSILIIFFILPRK